MPNVTRPYRAMSHADIDAYLVKLRHRVRHDQRPDPAAMTLPELDAYVQGLAKEADLRLRIHRAMLGGMGL